jgi:hypothetical protein
VLAEVSRNKLNRRRRFLSSCQQVYRWQYVGVRIVGCSWYGRNAALSRTDVRGSVAYTKIGIVLELYIYILTVP